VRVSARKKPSSTNADASDHALVVSQVNKSFVKPEEVTHTLKERALHPFRRVSHERFQALQDISFTVRKGEFFGIVGRNGSGKSTLLKCLAGIYAVDSGGIWVDGRLSTFIELGVGFNPDLAALDNVVLNGIMLGLSPKEARARYDRVIEFAELREFEKLKLKNYSSGMHVRLAFSVAIQVDADILLIDEVLAVGDAAFQQKCFDVFNAMRDEGRTIVFVTHDMSAVNRFCHRALLLEKGQTVVLGEPHKVADRYLTVNFDHTAAHDAEMAAAAEASGETNDEGTERDRLGDHKAHIAEVWLEGDDGERKTSVAREQIASIRALVEFEQDVANPVMQLAVENDEHVPIVMSSSEERTEHTGQFRRGDRAVFIFNFGNLLAPGRYFPRLTMTHRGSGLAVIDRYQRKFSFISINARNTGGVIDIPVHTDNWVLSRRPAPEPSAGPPDDHVDVGAV
jgi:ABC-type polysaccharide/polyol phosphate transport system ATPase subunit